MTEKKVAGLRGKEQEGFQRGAQRGEDKYLATSDLFPVLQGHGCDQAASAAGVQSDARGRMKSTGEGENGMWWVGRKGGEATSHLTFPSSIQNHRSLIPVYRRA